MAPRSRRHALSIVLVSATGEPLVEAYLQRAGVSTHVLRSTERLADVVPPAAAAIALFADEFPAEMARAALAAIRAHRPEAIVVVVTGEPAAFLEPLPALDGAVLVLPKPAWGWTLLDAVRARVEPPPANALHRIGRLLSRRP